MLESLNTAKTFSLKATIGNVSLVGERAVSVEIGRGEDEVT